MSRQNLVSDTVDQTLVNDVLQQLRDAKNALPFLINLSKEQRKKYRKMGPKSVEYVNETRAGAFQFASSLPQDFSLEEFDKDANLITQLFPLLVASEALSEALNDTILALGSDCMKEADEVYSFLKLAARTDANAKALVTNISRRFKGQGNFKSNGE
jgi:hypothetical protein